MNNKQAVRDAKKAWEADQTPETATAYADALSTAFKAGDIAFNDAIKAGTDALKKTGIPDNVVGHIANISRHVKGCSPEDTLDMARYLVSKGVKPGDVDAIQKVNEEMAAALPDGLPQLVVAIHRAIGDSNLPPEGAAALCRHLFDTGVRADDIEGVDIMETPAGGVAHIRVKPGSRHSDSIGPTVGTA